jgi:hypothetical protein
MSGHHNLTIYTGKDADTCRECAYGESVKSAHLFNTALTPYKESYICWNKKGSPTDDGCEEFHQANEAIKKLYKGV